MAMSKRERDAFDKLADELRIAKAFRFTEPVDRDVPRPEGGEMTTGWDFNAYSVLHGYGAESGVKELWSKCVSHGNMPYSPNRGSQGGMSLFSSKLLALRALRHELEEAFARKLAEVDAQIERELKGPVQ